MSNARYYYMDIMTVPILHMHLQSRSDRKHVPSVVPSFRRSVIRRSVIRRPLAAAQEGRAKGGLEASRGSFERV